MNDLRTVAQSTHSSIRTDGRALRSGWSHKYRTAATCSQVCQLRFKSLGVQGQATRIRCSPIHMVNTARPNSTTREPPAADTHMVSHSAARQRRCKAIPRSKVR